MHDESSDEAVNKALDGLLGAIKGNLSKIEGGPVGLPLLDMYKRNLERDNKNLEFYLSEGVLPIKDAFHLMDVWRYLTDPSIFRGLSATSVWVRGETYHNYYKMLNGDFTIRMELLSDNPEQKKTVQRLFVVDNQDDITSKPKDKFGRMLMEEIYRQSKDKFAVRWIDRGNMEICYDFGIYSLELAKGAIQKYILVGVPDNIPNQTRNNNREVKEALDGISNFFNSMKLGSHGDQDKRSCFLEQSINPMLFSDEMEVGYKKTINHFESAFKKKFEIASGGDRHLESVIRTIDRIADREGRIHWPA